MFDTDPYVSEHPTIVDDAFDDNEITGVFIAVPRMEHCGICDSTHEHGSHHCEFPNVYRVIVEEKVFG